MKLLDEIAESFLHEMDIESYEASRLAQAAIDVVERRLLSEFGKVHNEAVKTIIKELWQAVKEGSDNAR